MSNKKRGSTLDNPLVSVITPTFNRIKYLEACLQSVLAQSYPNVEHILVDGASTDGTVEMLASYQAKYPDRIRFISEPDGSTEEATNKGLKMADGQILGWLGSDDTYEPDALQTVTEFFRANPDVFCVYGDCNFIGQSGEIVGKFQTTDFNLKKTINDTCTIPWVATFYRREVIEKVGDFDTGTLKNRSDVDYLIRIGKLFPLHRIPKTLSNYRAHLDKRGAAVQTPRANAREQFMISRRHGGGLFSRRARRYYLIAITDPIRPVLLFIYYPVLAKTVELLRPIFGFAYPSLKKALVKLAIVRSG